MNKRGPSTVPSSIAHFSPQPAPPASRIVVKPRRNIADMMGTARIMTKASGKMPYELRFNCVAITWACKSIRPGIKVFPAISMTCAVEDCKGRSETSLILPSSTNT